MRCCPLSNCAPAQLTAHHSPLATHHRPPPGNELLYHLSAKDTAADIVLLAGIIQDIWSDVPSASRPLLYGPSTDACDDAGQLQIIADIAGVPGVGGFTYHVRPVGDCARHCRRTSASRDGAAASAVALFVERIEEMIDGAQERLDNVCGGGRRV